MGEIGKQINKLNQKTRQCAHSGPIIREGLIDLWLYKENNNLRDCKNVFTLHIPLWAPHTYGFVVLTSLTHARKTFWVVLQIGNREKPNTYHHPYVYAMRRDERRYHNDTNNQITLSVCSDWQKPRGKLFMLGPVVVPHGSCTDNCS
jgi:hypothetical protein